MKLNQHGTTKKMLKRNLKSRSVGRAKNANKKINVIEFMLLNPVWNKKRRSIKEIFSLKRNKKRV